MVSRMGDVRGERPRAGAAVAHRDKRRRHTLPPKAPAVLAALQPSAVLLAATLLAAVLLLPTWAGRAAGEPNFFEQRKIEAQALEGFRRVITLWQEEVYFELYDFGMAATKARISREDFAQRMVELSWVPRGELNAEHLKAHYRFRTVVYITVRIPYRHKFNSEERFSKDQTLVMVQEEGRWRIDLIALIRSPYSGV